MTNQQAVIELESMKPLSTDTNMEERQYNAISLAIEALKRCEKEDKANNKVEGNELNLIFGEDVSGQFENVDNGIRKISI